MILPFLIGIATGFLVGWMLGTAHAFQAGFDAYHQLLKAIAEEELETLRGPHTSHTQSGRKSNSDN